jgi:putative DNA primase/helicase
MKGTDPDDTLRESGPEGVRAHFDGLRGEAIPPLGGRKHNGDGRHSDQAPNESKRAKGNGNGAEVRPFISTRAHYDTAELFLESLATPLWRHRGDFYEWAGPSWPKVDEDKLRARLYPFLDGCQTKAKDGKPRPVKPNAPMVSGVLDAVRARAYLDATIEPPAWLDGGERFSAQDIVACTNGLLHLPTLRLLPHTPSFFNLNAVDYAYDPKAPEPKNWLAFLKQLWPDDQESIATLQQMFGYALTTDTRHQKALLIVGPKRSGKGTIGRVLTKLIGAHNHASPTLASLSERFGLAPLIGKNIAIISDARLSGRADQQVIVERLLSITGEDGQTIDRKYNPQPWNGKLPTRFVILTNQLPKLGDPSGALASRFIILLMTKSFYGHEDQGLTDKLLAELPSIFNWALAGWAELKRVGYFKQPASAKQAVEQLEDASSPIGAFLRERCEIGAGFTCTIGEIFAAWMEWCTAQHNDHAGTMASFGISLRAAFPSLEKKHHGPRGAQVPIYHGLRLKPQEW